MPNESFNLRQRSQALVVLKGSFLPDPMTEQLRTYIRHRLNLIQQEVECLKDANVSTPFKYTAECGNERYYGLTGIAIIKAICKGETNPKRLGDFKNGNCKKSKKEIA